MSATGFPLLAPMTVQPVPVPLQIAVRGVRNVSGDLMVAVQILSPTGIAMYFLPIENARAMARLLDEASGGLVVADALPTGLAAPNGRPH